MTSDGHIIEFDSFFTATKLAYRLIFLEPYGKRSEQLKALFIRIMFIVFILDLQAVTISESFYCWESIRDGTDVYGIMSSAFITFVVICDAKMYDLHMKRAELDGLMIDLEAMFPKTTEEQAFYNVEGYFNRFTKMVKSYLYSYLVLVWCFNVQFLLTWFLLDYLFNVEKIKIELVFRLSLPYDYEHHWTYPILYFGNMLAGHVAILSNIANDLLLCGIATHLTMHYDYLSKLIQLHIPEGENPITGRVRNPQTDLKFLSNFIAYHNKILILCTTMNGIFGRSLLFNFLLASLSICFVAFGVASKLNLYLMVCMVIYITMLTLQVYIISVYSQILVTASEGLNYAIYAHDWQNANVRYKKMLILLLQRTQQPSMITATNFLPIDMNSVTRVLKVSYQFFAVLRHFYN